MKRCNLFILIELAVQSVNDTASNYDPATNEIKEEIRYRWIFHISNFLTLCTSLLVAVISAFSLIYSILIFESTTSIENYFLNNSLLSNSSYQKLASNSSNFSFIFNYDIISNCYKHKNIEDLYFPHSNFTFSNLLKIKESLKASENYDKYYSILKENIENLTFYDYKTEFNYLDYDYSNDNIDYFLNEIKNDSLLGKRK